VTSLYKEFATYHGSGWFSSSKSGAANCAQCKLAKVTNLDTVPNIKTIQEAIDQPDALKYLKSVLSENCTYKQRLWLKGFKLAANTIQQPEDLGAFIKERFSASDKKKIQPISVNFCDEVLFSGGEKYNGVTHKKGENPTVAKGCTLHYALITGRRSHDGKCQYLIHNSWGKSCHHWDCEKDSSGVDTGKFWIDADALARNSIEAETLE
jgi:hypothetical protein